VVLVVVLMELQMELCLQQQPLTPAVVAVAQAVQQQLTLSVAAQAAQA